MVIFVMIKGQGWLHRLVVLEVKLFYFRIITNVYYFIHLIFSNLILLTEQIELSSNEKNPH